MVEFALVLPLLVMLVVGMMSLGVAMSSWIEETQLTSMGARYAAVSANPGAPQSLEDWIQGQASTGLKDDAETCIRFPGVTGTPTVGDPVQVEMAVEHTLVPILGLGTIAISATATMRLEADPSYGATCS